MHPELPVLGFDTTGKHCSVAIASSERILASVHRAADQRHAELLFPLIRECAAKAGIAMGDLAAIGVGTGPGSFTGVRLGVSAARGLALSLGVPAIGHSAFEMAVPDGCERVLVVVEGRRGFAFAKVWPAGASIQVPWQDIAGHVSEALPVAGYRAAEIAASLGSKAVQSIRNTGESVALLGSRKLPWHGPRPEPCYLRPPV